MRSKDELAKILMKKINLEFDMEKKMRKIPMQNQMQAQAILMLERTKVMDDIYLEFDIKLSELMAGTKHYDLESDERIKTLQASHK